MATARKTEEIIQRAFYYGECQLTGATDGEIQASSRRARQINGNPNLDENPRQTEARLEGPTASYWEEAPREALTSG